MAADPSPSLPPVEPRADPSGARAAGLSGAARWRLSRAEEYFKFWPSPHSGLLNNWARVLSFGLCLPFMVLGVVLSLGDARRRPGAGLLLVVTATYTLIHLRPGPSSGTASPWTPC